MESHELAALGSPGAAEAPRVRSPEVVERDRVLDELARKAAGMDGLVEHMQLDVMAACMNEADKGEIGSVDEGLVRRYLSAALNGIDDREQMVGKMLATAASTGLIGQVSSLIPSSASYVIGDILGKTAGSPAANLGFRAGMVALQPVFPTATQGLTREAQSAWQKKTGEFLFRIPKEASDFSRSVEDLAKDVLDHYGTASVRHREFVQGIADALEGQDLDAAALRTAVERGDRPRGIPLEAMRTLRDHAMAFITEYDGARESRLKLKSGVWLRNRAWSYNKDQFLARSARVLLTQFGTGLETLSVVGSNGALAINIAGSLGNYAWQEYAATRGEKSKALHIIYELMCHVEKILTPEGRQARIEGRPIEGQHIDAKEVAKCFKTLVADCKAEMMGVLKGKIKAAAPGLECEDAAKVGEWRAAIARLGEAPPELEALIADMELLETNQFTSMGHADALFEIFKEHDKHAFTQMFDGDSPLRRALAKRSDEGDVGFQAAQRYPTAAHMVVLGSAGQSLIGPAVSMAYGGTHNVPAYVQWPLMAAQTGGAAITALFAPTAGTNNKSEARDKAKATNYQQSFRGEQSLKTMFSVVPETQRYYQQRRGFSVADAGNEAMESEAQFARNLRALDLDQAAA